MRILLVAWIFLSLVQNISAQDKSFEKLTVKEFQQRFQEWAHKGYIPREITVKVVQDVEFFNLVMEKSKKNVYWAGEHGMTDEVFDQKQKEYEAKALATFLHLTYSKKGTRYHLAVWKEVLKKEIIVWPKKEKIHAYGKNEKKLESIDKMMIDLLYQYQLPGALLAISKNGKLVYSRAFGYGDFVGKKPMRTNSLMRIASVSKPFTAVAILKLIEDNKLKLSDKVFDLLPHKPYANADKIDPRFSKITIGQLLHHTAGFDRENSFDPMILDKKIAAALKVPSPPGSDNIIRYMLAQKLDFEPGQRYAYSNYGYCLLGRVIEEVTKMPYEKYVKQAVLRPIGIKSMRVGSSLKNKQDKREVVYFENPARNGPSVFGKETPYAPSPYGGFDMSALDANGGWIASAEDLVRFACAFDNPDRCKVLGRKTIDTMLAPPEPNIWPDKTYHYACGWLVRPGRFFRGPTTWHVGSLAGTNSLLVRRSDGFNWAVLFNTRDCTGTDKQPYKLVAPLIHKAVNAIEEWPDVDYFSK